MRIPRLLLVGLDAVLLIILGLFIWEGREITPFHGDESTFIAMSHDYAQIVHNHSIDGITFEAEPRNEDDQWLRVMNGSINPLTIGLAWDIAGFTVEDLNTPWDWMTIQYPFDLQWTWNEQAGNMPEESLLYVARIPSTIFTILSMIVLFGIVWQLTKSHPAAWITCLMYATTPALLVNGRRAMQEGSLLFSTALAVFAALQAVRSLSQPTPDRPRIIRWLILLGTASGLAVASKHTGTVIVAATYLAVLLTPLVARWNDGVPVGVPFDRYHIYGVMGSGLLSILVFQMLMPVWWSLPHMLVLAALSLLFFSLCIRASGRRLWMFRAITVITVLLALEAHPNVFGDLIRFPSYIIEQRDNLMERQVVLHGNQDTMSERIKMILRQAVYADPQYFENQTWAALDEVTAQIEAYENSGLSGSAEYPGRDTIVIVLFVIGGFALLARQNDTQNLLISLWLLAVIGSLLANPLPWQRYYLILYAPRAIVIGLGFNRIEIAMTDWLRSRREKAISVQA